VALPELSILLLRRQGRIKLTRGPGKVVTAMPRKHLVQLHNVSHAFVSTL